MYRYIYMYRYMTASREPLTALQYEWPAHPHATKQCGEAGSFILLAVEGPIHTKRKASGLEDDSEPGLD